MEKFIYYNDLYLIYKDLINIKNQEIFDLYYGENLSMQEIADIKKISKSRVGLVIKNVEKKLDYYESILKIKNRNTELNNILEINDITEIKSRISEILKGE